MDMPKRPIGGGFAWTVPEVVQRDDWICRLAEADVAEIDAAVRATRQRGLGIQEIERDDFPLDRLTTRLGALRAQIRSGLGFGYIKGLPVERYDRETLIRIYWGLSRHIGDPITQNRNGHVVGHVIDVGDTEQDHNRRLPDLLPELYKPIYMDRRGEVPAGKQPWFGMPLFSWHRGLFTGYSPIRQYIESLARFPDAPRLSNAQREALDVYYGICEEERFCLKLHFEPGDIQFLQNHVVFHSRTEYVDGPSGDGWPKRHLMRMWLS